MDNLAAFSILFSVAYFTYTVILALAPEPPRHGRLSSTGKIPFPYRGSLSGLRSFACPI